MCVTEPGPAGRREVLLALRPTLACGGFVGAFASKVTKESTTMSGPAICTLICSGVPDAVDSQAPTLLPPSQKQKAPSAPSPVGSRAPW